MTESSKQRTFNRLSNLYPLDKIGIWKVIGEDENADFGGSHYCPTLGFFSGMYRNVVEMAMELPNFFTWGHGGEIQEITIIPCSKEVVEQRKELLAKEKELKEELDKVEKELKRNGC